MLKTPASFIPLHAPQAHPDPHTFLFCSDALLVRDTDLALPDAAACAALDIHDADLHPVGMWQGRYCRTGSTAQAALPAPGYTFRKLRSLFGVFDDGLMALAGRAFQIAEWARTHRYCGACGSPMTPLSHERAVRCTGCGLTAYPRISPAMMVLIRKGDAILLARHATGPTGRFSALAGFVEAGESVEEAVHREVREEVGLTVANLRYFGSQSWPFPHSLMIAFTADYAGGELSPEPQEIAEARWFGPGDTLPEIATSVSIAHALISAHLPRGRSA